MFSIFRKRHRFDLLWQLIKTNFKLRYQNSILGVLWVLIKPYSSFLVLYLVWSTTQKTSAVGDYPVYLLLGLVTFTYFQELIIFGQMSLLERVGIILKINFPRQIVVTSALFNGLINLGINLIFLFIIVYIRHLHPGLFGILYYLLIVVTFFIFSLGISFFLSTLTIRFRDLKNVLDLGFFILFWLTPVVYTPDSKIIGDNTAAIVQANPIAFLLTQTRAAFGVYGVIDVRGVLVFLVISLILVFFGWKYFNKNVKSVAEYF